MRLFMLLGVIGLSAVFGAATGTGTGSGAADFVEFTNVVNDADTTAKATAGVFGTWFIGLLPLIGLIVGILGGMKYLRKHSNGQEENFAKELGYGGLGAFIGLLVAIIFITAIGAGLMGDSTLSFEVLNKFWRGIFGV